ncbi:hypothetical protein J5X84_15590 [Streptosporangiaceae bacterium NEAU-GS5]|nr:hypothetical protein [Streptosporangiaceae bacterium NEAU-GS5]
MRIRVSFRYDSSTGDVQVFQVSQADDAPRTPDHDRRHEAATSDVARVVAQNPTIDEVPDEEPAPRIHERADIESQQRAERRRHGQS